MDSVSRIATLPEDSTDETYSKDHELNHESIDHTDAYLLQPLRSSSGSPSDGSRVRESPPRSGSSRRGPKNDRRLSVAAVGRTGSACDRNADPDLPASACASCFDPTVFKFLGLDGGERHLGIPAVRDRVVQQLLLDILQPIFDLPPRNFKAVTRQVMVIVRAAAANRQWRKQRCSFGNMVASMWSIWIFRNALTGWIMT